MDYFTYRHNILHIEDVPLTDIAQSYGTPAYIYSKTALERYWQAFDQALKDHLHLICYAVKANSNLAILSTLARLGAGFDIVSGGELERVLRAGGAPQKIVFSGVGKTEAELRKALQVGILCFNIESAAELTRLNQLAAATRQIAPIAIRVNPDIDAKTHPYISTGLKENKFGLSVEQAFCLYLTAAQLPNIRIIGIDCHIGSQLTHLDPFIEALEKVMLLVEKLHLKGIHLRHIDVGGGLGIRYQTESPPSPKEYGYALSQVLGNEPYEIILEPGRALVGNAGLLLTKVDYLKHTEHKHFAIVDAALNDLIRPALYQAWHDILPVQPHFHETTYPYDIVGPICETGDFLGKQRSLALQEGDLLAIASAGAYGFVMSSNYNSRGRAPELLVTGNQVKLIRRRETIEDLLALEIGL